MTVNTQQQGALILAFDELNKQICNCRKCRLWQGAIQAVPGEGPVNATVMLVGQNPGADEDKTGRPFVGKAGKYLTQVLAENGLKREELFITNIVKHRTPKNRKPYTDEITACLPYLTTQISIIKPKKILMLGIAARKTPRIKGIEYFELIHPLAASRFPRMGEKFQEQCRAALKT